MATKVIDAQLLQKAFIAGAYNLEKNKDYINELNVFPVPDGDTGSNMSLTIMAAAREVSALENPSMDELSKTISSGSLRGSRGNSGVILSQLLRGFCKEIKGKKQITVSVLSEGFVRAVETAYKAVMKPKEGTILTVAKGVAEKAVELSEMDMDFETLGQEILDHGNEVLKQTPELLPVLKEAGVVDSGGQGLMEFLTGAYNGLTGKEVINEPLTSGGAAKTQTMSSEEIDTSHIKYGYCTEFIIMLEKEYNAEIETKFKEFLTSIGDSLVVVSDDEIVKVHVHTNHPGLAFEKGLEYGSLTSMKIDNMREEHKEKVIHEQDRKKAAEQEAAQEAKKEEPKKPFGFVAVSVGEGLNDIFKDLGVDHIIEGGQTMNPSTEDVLDAISKVNAETIFVFPNNKNIILAANQAAEIEEEKKVIVIPTKTIPQGISALISFDEGATAEANQAGMEDAITAVKSGQVTYAVRDTSIDGKEIKTGDYMGIDDAGIQAVGQDITEVVKDLIGAMADEDSELLSIYYGSDVEEEKANALVEAVQAAYPDFEVEAHAGGQPIYYYILSLE
ncbi:DAK2 domain-containing protein [Eubacterium sp. MSJ-33]|uniref:DAK2 domain-containing protein n=1 Tax=Eubacterium sp. MSJ-33 TaxID=2841528 RepID=UPI001C74DB76|nr:DAK2 domain-containing protein [Eubacterium sp. MSJ-33]QWT53737.1 DAK2 domain-containing protein [Eubacterium sp. MSJ-33]